MARPRQVTDEQILATMRSSVIRHGAAVALDVVAEQLGVTAPALLKRFGSRQELFLKALMPPEVPPWLTKAEAGPDDRPLALQLADLFTDISDFFIEILPGLSALRQSGFNTEEMALKQKGPLRTLRALARWLEAARARGLTTSDEHETAAAAILGAVQGNIMMAHLYKNNWSSRSQREYLRDLVQLFTRALAPPRRSRTKSP